MTDNGEGAHPLEPDGPVGRTDAPTPADAPAPSPSAAGRTCPPATLRSLQ